jgi:glycosyltransferase involved in cell wall biosynthesis
MKIALCAPLANSTDGYGKAALGMKEVFSRMKAEGRIDDVTAVDINQWLTTTKPFREYGQFDLVIVSLNPQYFTRQSNQARRIIQSLADAGPVFMSIVWETTPLPSSWSHIWNIPEISGFLAPSYFVIDQIRDAMGNSGKPVMYYPHFIDIDEYPARDFVERPVFSCMAIGQGTIRKGIFDACVAFVRSIGRKDDTELNIRGYSISQFDPPVDMYIRELMYQNTDRKPSNVYMIDRKLNHDELVSFYHDSDLVLCTSRGEGFGLPAAEAMAMGLPVVYTDWSSLHEVCRSDGNYPVGYILDEAVGMLHHGYEPRLKYAVPCISSIMEALEKAYASWSSDKQAYYNTAMENRRIVHERYGYPAVSRAIEEILKVCPTNQKP